MTGQFTDMRPVAKVGVNFPVVDHRETVVTAPGKEGQYVHAADTIAQPLLKKIAQYRQRRHTIFVNGVTIADHPLIFFAPRGCMFGAAFHPGG